MTRDDDRLARISQYLRREAGVRQADLKTSRFVTQEIEAGRAGTLRVDQVLAHFAGLDAKAQVSIWWNGAALDRLIDRDHAQVVDAVASLLPRFRFSVITEYTFNEYGERGSIDIFGAHEDARNVFIGEAKSKWGSREETLRRQDMKVRLAPRLAEKAFGWRPLGVASVLIFPRDRTAQRLAMRHRAALTGYSARAREIRAWLRLPVGHLGGIWFVSNAALGRRED